MKNFLLFLFCWLPVATAHAARYYVKTDGNDNNTGQSWNTAFATLQKALETTTGANNNDEIWVAAGTYYPTYTFATDRHKHFEMKNGVAIYGGFAGTENIIADRVSALIHTTNKTTLSGDVDLDGILDDENVYQVIRNLGVNSTAQLDGFTISDGKATGTNTYHFGGGMYNGGSSPTITNCRFTNNRADSGGGMCNVGSSPTITNCSFTENYANDAGAGMYSYNSSSPIISDCIFSKNTSTNSGGGIEFFVAAPKVTRCIFSGNSATFGAGMMNRNSPSIFTNCSVFGNKATDQGGGVFIEYSAPVFTNCSMSGNQAAAGGGIYTNTSTTNAVTMRNCIVWGNSTEIYPTASVGNTAYTFTTTIIKGINNGSGVFDGTQDPNFIAQPDQYAVPTTVGNMQLAICSPARNAGDNTVFNPGQTPDLSTITTDLAGNSRIFNTTIDLGAYEMQSVAITLYVKSDGNDSNDGLSWGTAVKTLQRALDFVCSGKQIWVAAGTYYPTEGSGRDKTFKMKGGVAIYGGFAGTENIIADRVSSLIHTTNKTTLSGDVDQDGILDEENVYHVISNQGIGHNAQIDGFTISDGYANGTATGHYGGGMLNINSSPTVTNCRFTNNRGDNGGGMCNRASSSPTITNCSFIGNYGDLGGGLYELQSSTPTITDCFFSNNTANLGGGMYITGATPTLIRCVFSGNTATNQGAGVMAVSSASIFTNCSFLGNKANNQGGGFYNFKANPVFTNCSFSGNKAPKGGGIDAYDGLTSEIKLRNCIVWGNDTEIPPTTSGGNVTYTFTNTIVKGMNNGSGVLDGTQDPLFVSQPDYALAPTTIGDLRLQACSPAINVGSNTVFNAGQTPDLSSMATDLAGNSRIFNITVDLGAYEYQSDNSLTIAEYSSHPTTCGGTDGSITLTGLLVNTTYSVTYTKDAASPQTLTLTSDVDGLITLEHLTEGSYTDIIATYGSCVSNAVNVTLNDPDRPALVLGVIPPVCIGTAGVALPFSDLTASPDQYSLDYNSIAEGAGFTDVIQAALPASPLALSIPPTASATVYNASLTVRNSTTGCSSLPKNIAISIHPQPVGPTLNVKTPNAASICFGTGISATFNAGSGGVGCLDDFILIIDNGSPVTYTPGSTVGANAVTSIILQGRRANCNLNSGCNGTDYMTLASWRVNPLPTATIAGTTAVCQNAAVPGVTFAGANGTAPYIFNYQINNGPELAVTAGSNTATLSQTTANAGIFNYALTSVKDGNGCQQAQNDFAVITVNALPIISAPQADLCTGLSMTLSLTSGGTWLSSNPAIASVNNQGLVSALSPGSVNFTFTQTGTGCNATTNNITIKQTPSSNLTASQYDVCPNTEVTLNPNCSLPTATVHWNPGAPTVTPNAATLPYIYKASCTADGCTGNESSAEIRTHRILVDMKDLDVGTLPLPIVRALKDNMATTNLINAPAFPRRWTFIAKGCDASESAVFKLIGPVNISTIDNDVTYAMFSNEGSNFYSLDHPNYGNGGSFPNGVYSLTVDLRSRDGAGGPFPKNRIAAGSLLATRTLQFTVESSQFAAGRQGMAGGEQEAIASDNAAFAQVMPNPVANSLHLKIKDAKGENINVSLLDASGRALLQRSFVPESNAHLEEVNVSDISNGMYFLKVKAGDKQQTLKVIKVQ